MKLIIETTYKLVHDNESNIATYKVRTESVTNNLADFQSMIEANEDKQGSMERMITKELLRNDFYKKEDYASGDEQLQDKE